MTSEHIPPKSSRPVFRAEAVKQYVRSREEVILPRYISKRSIMLLWVALGVIVLGGATLLMVPLPLYTSGTAVALQGEDRESGERTRSLAVSVPIEALAQVRPGQAAYFHDSDGPRRFAGRVVAVDGNEASRNGGASRAVPSGEGANRVERPSAIVHVQLATGLDAPPTAACPPRGCRVDIRIGAPRALAFFAPGDLRTGN